MKDKKFNLSNRIYSKKTISNITKKVNLLGVDNTLDPINLLNIRLLSSICIFFVLLYFLDFGYLIAPLVTFLFYQFFFTLTVDVKINERRKVLEKESMYFFEILALSLEAGRSIKNAIMITTDSIDSSLSREFKRVIKDINYGKDLNEALNDLKSRIPSDNINNIVLSIRQSNIFGNDIIETVYQQIEYIRQRRVLEAKAEISKIPVRISVISVIFFIPLLLLLLLGPMLIKLIS